MKKKSYIERWLGFGAAVPIISIPLIVTPASAEVCAEVVNEHIANGRSAEAMMIRSISDADKLGGKYVTGEMLEGSARGKSIGDKSGAANSIAAAGLFAADKNFGASSALRQQAIDKIAATHCK